MPLRCNALAVTHNPPPFALRYVKERRTVGHCLLKLQVNSVPTTPERDLQAVAGRIDMVALRPASSAKLALIWLI